MTKKSIFILLFLVGIAGIGFYIYYNSSNANEQDVAKVEKPSRAAHLYQTKCAICHSGASLEAPKLESLQLLSPATVIKTLRTGVMRNQASTLSKEEQELVANYISEVNDIDEDPALIKGLCNVQEEDVAQNVSIGNWGYDLSNTRYNNRSDVSINAQNVSQLQLDWAFAFPGVSRARVQPTIAGNTIYTASQHGTVYALDKATGCIRWTFQADAEIRSAITIGTNENGKATRLYFGDFNAKVYALDLKTQSLIWTQQIDEHAVATITGSLNLYKNRLYIPVSSTEIFNAHDPNYECCTFRGSVVALSATTGKMIWKRYTISEAPSPQGLNSANRPIYAPSGAPVWTSPTIDTKRDVLYIGTGENYTRPTSVTSDAIIAMALEDGAIQWVRQTVPKDAWNGACMTPGSPNCPEDAGPDYDFGASPILIERDNASDLILAGQKSGMVYALDPDKDGAIVWQKRVGRGGIMGGVHWGMATDGTTLFVPVNDHSVYPEDAHKPAFPGVHAVDLNNGQFLWSAIEKDRCGDVQWQCSPGISAAISLTPGLVFAGALDGVLKAYAAQDGKELWVYDTNQEFDATNGIKAFGGTIDSDGPVIDAHQVFINSGYAKFGEKAGNVLLAFTLE